MRSGIIAALCLVMLAPTRGAQIAAQAEATIAAIVNSFHNALRRADSKAAMELLAPDAMILENGSVETRAEYERNHLKEDIAFAREVVTTRSPAEIGVEGNAAWVIHTNRTSGSFHGRKINSTGVELMILTKSESGWRIRAIHWSSRQSKPSM